MIELITFTQTFGPITGLIMFMIYRQLTDTRARRSDEAMTATLARIEKSVKAVENEIVPTPATTPEPEAPAPEAVVEGPEDAAEQPPT